MKKRVISYSRQSVARAGETSETSLSLESQEQKIAAWAESNGMDVAEAFRDHDLRGDNPNRPALRKAIDALGAGDTLAVYDLSRLARDNVLQETIYRSIAAKGADLVSVTEPHAADDLFRGIMGVINQQFRKQLGQRISSAKEASARRGKFTGRPPVGYLMVDGELAPDPETAPIIREIFTRIAAGETLVQVANYMAEINFKPLQHIGHLNRALRRYTYSGGVPHHDEVFWCEGGPCHEPIVSKDLQDRAIAMMEARAHKHPRKNSVNILLNGSVIHECGKQAYSRVSESGTSRQQISFNCASMSNRPPCGVDRRQIAQNVLLRALVELLRIDLSGIPDLPEEAIIIAEENYHRIVPDRDAQRAELTRQKTLLSQRNDRAVQTYLDGVRTREWMLNEVSHIEEQIEAVNSSLASLPKALDLQLLRDLVDAKIKHKEHINALSFEQAAQLIGVLGKMVFGPSGITIQYHEPYCHLITEPAVMNWPLHHHATRK